MRILSCLSLLVMFHTASSQTIVSGKVMSESGKPVKRAKVDFVCYGDTIFSAYTNDAGEYEYSETSGCTHLSVIVSKRRFAGRKETFRVPVDSIAHHILLDFTLHSVLEDNFCPPVNFQVNDYEQALNIDIENLQYIFEEYPMMRFKTVISLYPGEPGALAEKRLEVFKKVMVDNQIDISHITFDSKEIRRIKPHADIFGNFDPSDCLNLPYISFIVTPIE